MNVVAADKGQVTHGARPALAVPLMTYAKGVAGCALIALCFSGAAAALTKMPFGPTAEALATIVGAGIGGILAWRTGNAPSQN
jgi:hypothetical protein